MKCIFIRKILSNTLHILGGDTGSIPVAEDFTAIAGTKAELRCTIDLANSKSSFQLIFVRN